MLYLSNSDKSKQVSSIYYGDDSNTSRKIAIIYHGDENGKARTIYSASSDAYLSSFKVSNLATSFEIRKE